MEETYENVQQSDNEHPNSQTWADSLITQFTHILYTKNSLLINSRFIITALKHWFFCSCCCTTCWLLNYTLRKMLMEETWRSGNFIMTQMGKGTTCWEEVRGVKLNRTYALCRRQQWFFFIFFLFLLFSSAHWLLWSPSGWRKRRWRTGLWAPSEALCWAIKMIMRWTSSSGGEFAAKQQRFSLLVNINEASITSWAVINLAKWLTWTAVTQG